MTSDLQQLVDAFDAGSLVRPVSGSVSLVDVARAVGQLNGAEVRPSAHSSNLVDLIGGPDHLVFVLADGLGLSTLEHLPRDSFLRTHLAMEITTVFPSTTASALTTLATGEWPAQHAVTGWWTHLPEIDGAATVLQFTRRSDGILLEQLGVLPERVFPAPAMAAGQSRDVLALLPDEIAASVYSTYLFGRDGARGYGRVEDAVETAVSRVRRSAGRTSTYLYFPHVDSAAHQYGASHDAVRQALRLLDGVLAAWAGLSATSPGSSSRRTTAFWTPARTRYTRSPTPIPWFRRCGLHRPETPGCCTCIAETGCAPRPVSCSGSGSETGSSSSTPTRAESAELLGPGPISTETRRRIGGLIAVSRGVDVVQYQPYADPMVGHHSGLTPDEMMIPLIVA